MAHSDRPDPEALQLESGAPPATADAVIAALTVLGFETHTLEHGPLYTVDDAKQVDYGLPGAHTKNLFLRNKKGRMFLVVLEQDRQLDLKALRDRLAVPGGQLAFASSERMARYLGVVPGSVTPLAAINDHGGLVRVVIDKQVLAHEWIWLHPCRNTHSTRMRTADLLAALDAWQHEATVLDFDADEVH
ncbi:MAG: prolyl-tRNA synthetase associated domain-containing protein [Pseudomonadota bacterium]